MHGMGQSQGGPRLAPMAARALVGLITVLSVFIVLTGTSIDVAGAESEELPDLVIEEVYNLTEVFKGEDSFFNVTIKNQGNEAYLPRESGELEIYGYRDDETNIASFKKVFHEIYRRENVTINIKVRFDKMGNHSLRVVLDPSNLVDEENDGNNVAITYFAVVPSQENRPPHADGGNDRFGYLEEPMLFSARYSEDPDDDPLTYSWIFGDGGEGSGRFTNHTYLYKGQYGASLLVSDGEKIDIDSFTVTVTEPLVNNPPFAVILVQTHTVETNEYLELDGRSSSDPDRDELMYEWDFDDADGVNDWVRGALVITKWMTAGSYTVTLRISDDETTTTATETISVVEPEPPNESPSANAGMDKKVTAGSVFNLAGGGSDPDGTIVSWEWDLDGDRSYDTYSDTDGSLTHKFEEPGLHTIWLRVTDDDGTSSSDSIIITVDKAKADGNESPGATVMFAILALIFVSLVSKNGSKRGPWRWYQG